MQVTGPGAPVTCATCVDRDRRVEAASLEPEVSQALVKTAANRVDVFASLLSRGSPPAPVVAGERLPAVPDAELGVDRLEMPRDRARRDVEEHRGFGVRHAAGDGLEDLALPLGELGGDVVRALLDEQRSLRPSGDDRDPNRAGGRRERLDPRCADRQGLGDPQAQRARQPAALRGLAEMPSRRSRPRRVSCGSRRRPGRA